MSRNKSGSYCFFVLSSFVIGAAAGEVEIQFQAPKEPIAMPHAAILKPRDSLLPQILLNTLNMSYWEEKKEREGEKKVFKLT
jgi:hypothetical protein